MIAGVRGRVLSAAEDAAVIDVRGIAFRVQVPASTLAHLRAAEGEIFVITRLIVREDDVSLYGFLSQEEERLFSLLLGVGGVGPKVALGLLDRFRPGELALAIAQGDERKLTQASGVGRKLAARIALELRDRLLPAELAQEPAAGGEDEALLALLALGVPERSAQSVLEGLEGSVEERVRHALGR